MASKALKSKWEKLNPTRMHCHFKHKICLQLTNSIRNQTHLLMARQRGQVQVQWLRLRAYQLAKLNLQLFQLLSCSFARRMWILKSHHRCITLRIITERTTFDSIKVHLIIFTSVQKKSQPKASGPSKTTMTAPASTRLASAVPRICPRSVLKSATLQTCF